MRTKIEDLDLDLLEMKQELQQRATTIAHLAAQLEELEAEQKEQRDQHMAMLRLRNRLQPFTCHEEELALSEIVDQHGVPF